MLKKVLKFICSGQFLKILELQAAACALIFVTAVGIKAGFSGQYETVKAGAFSQNYKITNVGSLNDRLDELASNNKFIALLLGRKYEPHTDEKPEDLKDPVTEETSASGHTEEIPVVDAIYLGSSFDYDDNEYSEPEVTPKYSLPETLIRPVKGGMTSPFGQRADPFTGKLSFHTGIDLAASTGTSVKAAMSGTVTTGKSSSGGNYVIVKHKDGFTTYYAHLSKITVKNGAAVKAGQEIAKSGSTGRSTGPHLHFEIRKGSAALNPADYGV